MNEFMKDPEFMAVSGEIRGFISRGNLKKN